MCMRGHILLLQVEGFCSNLACLHPSPKSSDAVERRALAPSLYAPIAISCQSNAQTIQIWQGAIHYYSQSTESVGVHRSQTTKYCVYREALDDYYNNNASLYNCSSSGTRPSQCLESYNHPYIESNIKVSLNSLLHHTVQKLCRHCSQTVGTPARSSYSSPLTFWTLQGISAQGC
jgi:hypothetical protein